MEFLDKLRAQLRSRLDERAAKVEELEALLAVPAAEERSELNELETEKFAEAREFISGIDEETAELRARITEMESVVTADQEARAEAAHIGETVDATETRVSVKSNEITYRQNGDHSFFKDLLAATAPGRFDNEARGRLQRHAEEAAIELRTTPNRNDGQLGELVPPLWMLSRTVGVARPGRVAADLCQTDVALPAGTDSVQIPKISVGTLVGAQTDNGSVSERDMTSTSVVAPVNTLAGQQRASLQLIEQSPLAGGIDQLIFNDLIADWAFKLDDAVLNGSGTSGAHTGLLTATNTTSVVYTATTPTGAGVYAAIAQGISNVARQRYLPADAILMTPSRFYWLAAQVDGNGRPLITPAQNGPFNAVGVAGDPVAQGAAGQILGLPVYLDSVLPTTASTNQDRIIVGRFQDAVLMEGDVKTRVLYETDAATLTVRFQLWNYSAFTSSYRYGASFAVVSGTGMVSPSGY
jgi:HK97 family phage major capsid protein